MIELIPFKAQHAYQMVHGKITPEFVKAMLRYEQEGNSMTVLYDKQLFCCGGLVIEAGNGSLWMVNSNLVGKHPLTFHKTIKKWLKLFMELYNLNRMQAFVDASEPKHVRWVESLGFSMEGLMRKFYSGKDFFMYARIRGGGE